MCGIFAFKARFLASCLDFARPDIDLLLDAAEGAARRGPHGHGWTIRGGATSHDFGQFVPEALVDEIRLAHSVDAVLGHARLATFGALDDRDGLQPIVFDGHYLAHNGNVYNAAALVGSPLPSDSWALLVTYATARRGGMTPAEALDKTLGMAEQKAWAVVVLDADGTMVAAHHGLPLYGLRHPTGVYLSSRALDGASLLPVGDVVEVD